MPTSRFNLNIFLPQIKYDQALWLWHGKVRVKPSGSVAENLFAQFGPRVKVTPSGAEKEAISLKKYRQDALGWTIWNHWYWLLFPDKKNNFKMCNKFNSSFYKGGCGLFHFFLFPMLEQKFPGVSLPLEQIRKSLLLPIPLQHHRIFARVPWDLNSRPAAFWDPTFSTLNVPVYLGRGSGEQVRKCFSRHA